MSIRWDDDEANGGPAFPHEWQSEYGIPMGVHGMTLRDWFAGQVLCSGADHVVAYRIADAMLKERLK